MTSLPYILPSPQDIPTDFVTLVQSLTHQTEVEYLAQILWHRGLRDSQQLQEFLLIDYCPPQDDNQWDEEMIRSISRIESSKINREKIVIWGDWQVDSLMAAIILKEGLQGFIADEESIIYHFPPRHLADFGLNRQGIDGLAQQGVTLMLMLNSSNHNETEINYAQSLGIDIIMIDRISLPCQRPPVFAWLNSFNISWDEHFSRVSIVYKLIESLAKQYPDYFSQPVTNLLDIVALGLLADKVNLQGEGRYWVKQGMELIAQRKRPNITNLSRLMAQTGDRDLDISYGLPHRIRAISSLATDIDFVLNFLTNDHYSLVNRLPDRAEKIYFTCLSFLQKMWDEVKKKVNLLELVHQELIILQNDHWQIGMVNLLAQLVSQEYNKPVLLLSTNFTQQLKNKFLGYFYCADCVNINELILENSYLFDNYQIEQVGMRIIISHSNLNLFQEILRQNIKQQQEIAVSKLTIDLKITVKDINQSLDIQLKLLEPYSINNSRPLLLLTNCSLENIKHFNLSNKSKKVSYKKTHFQIRDNSYSFSTIGFWYGHYSQELNSDNCYHLLGHLEYNPSRKYYYFRVVQVQLAIDNSYQQLTAKKYSPILDYRNNITISNDLALQKIESCPSQWQEIHSSYQKALPKNQNLALTYSEYKPIDIKEKWRQMIGFIKYLINQNIAIELETFSQKNNMSQPYLEQVLDILRAIGIDYQITDNILLFSYQKTDITRDEYQKVWQKFQYIIKTETLAKQYFSQISIEKINKEVISSRIN